MPTTSGTSAFAPGVIDIINQAYRINTIIGDEETATSSQLSSGVDALQSIISGWQASQINVWCEQEALLFLEPEHILYKLGLSSPDHAVAWDSLAQTTLASASASGASTIVVASPTGWATGYVAMVQLDDGTNFWSTVSGVSGSTVTLSTHLDAAALAGACAFAYPVTGILHRPLKVMLGRRYTYLSRQNIPMLMWARLDYQSQPTPYNTGTPTAFFFDPQTGGQSAYNTALPLAQMNIWPAPVDNTNAIRFTCQRQIQEVTDLAQGLDFPREWVAPLKWTLALETGIEAGTPEAQLATIRERAAYWYGIVSAWNREPEGIRFAPAMRASYRTR